MIKGLHHVAISTRNMEKLCRFYCDTFGFEVLSEVDWESGTELGDQCDGIIGLKNSSAKAVMIGLGGLNLEIFEYNSPTPKPKAPDWQVCDHGYTHICMEVEDIAMEYDRLLKAGMTFHAPPSAEPQNGVKAIYGRDPENNVIEILEIFEET